ncbi:F-box/kelch-repeat protein At3g06240-like isoform X1 [Cornus florida]|uniref:F-box/kelch-repeat protein At3g06240-like isoform X1 n=1 Tax=Cornus florida TaxID=4283 RepID=UPI00289FE3D3|nr:F-box/kelch-repeat protein At3g06240-like isoform X1 [Cornus florida]XP_059661226.1 F-box/kelch-repeat protein At3g06240-like isoform X1 [Cornus florida]
MSDYLPQETLVDIFTRLPIKTLLQIRCVCKTWYALINSPIFITTHINRAIANTTTPLLLLRYHSGYGREEEHYSVHCDDETFDECLTLDCPIDCYHLYQYYYYRIVGSCNGLICLSDDLFAMSVEEFTNVIILWNPAVRKSVRLPMPRFTYDSHGLHGFVLAFGFDSRTNDYKVVRIVHLHDSFDFVVRPEVDVYELSTGVWRSSGSAAPPYYTNMGHWSHVFVNGASHWVAFEPGVEQNRNLILSFDMGSEVFIEMILPDSVANVCKLNLSIALFGESLSLFHYDDNIWSTDKSCCIWVMKEYGVEGSWTKLFTVDLGGINKVLGFRKTGEVLVEKSDGELVSYDPKSEDEVEIGICSYKSSLHLDTYMESLVLL